jgi:hypothetical protein
MTATREQIWQERAQQHQAELTFLRLKAARLARKVRRQKRQKEQRGS